MESVRARVPTEDSKIAFLGDKTHLYDRLLHLELDRPRPRAARLFSWMERARAQSLWDRARDPNHWSGEAALPRERRSQELRQRISWLHARVSRLELGTESERKHARELRQELARAERDWAESLRRGGEAGARRRRGPRPEEEAETGFAAMIPELPEGWGFLSYHLGSGVSLALAVTSRGVLWRSLSPDLSDRVARLADRLDFQWAAAAASSAHGASTAAGAGPSPLLCASTDSILRELYKLLWRPLEEAGIPPDLSWMVSPHGPLHRLPLPALLGPQGYLAQGRDFAIVPSARAWRELPRARSQPVRRAWIAGTPSEGLPAVRLEMDRVPARLQGWSVVRDFAPTRKALYAAGAKAGLIHLAAHGFLRADNPFYSHLLLADGPLFVHDLRGLRLSGATVVLTACSSGRGASPAGDEWIGLARGFLLAGASAVVASLWPIEDAATVELMDRFYQEWARGTGTAPALARAMRGMIPDRAHPWHWASFAVLGGIPGPARQSRAILRHLR